MIYSSVSRASRVLHFFLLLIHFSKLHVYHITVPIHFFSRPSRGLFRCGKCSIGLIAILVLIAIVVILVLAIGLGVGIGVANRESNTLYNSIRIENLISHLQVLILIMYML